MNTENTENTENTATQLKGHGSGLIVEQGYPRGGTTFSILPGLGHYLL